MTNSKLRSHILIVEDDNDSQQMIAAMLNYCGATSTITGNAKDALATITDEPSIQMAIIDLYLPGQMDGIGLIKAIRKLPGLYLPCLAITAYHNSTVRETALNAGYTSYFAKPLRITSFLEQVISMQTSFFSTLHTQPSDDG